MDFTPSTQAAQRKRAIRARDHAVRVHPRHRRGAFSRAAVASVVIAAAAFTGSRHCAAYAHCFEVAAAHYTLDAALLRAIAQVESANNPRARNINRDGSIDIGLMQVNSMHVPRLAKQGISEQSLWDPCVSILAGAFILAEAVAVFGPTWNAVGAYNAGFRPEGERLRLRYAMKVAQAYAALSRRGVHHPEPAESLLAAGAER